MKKKCNSILFPNDKRLSCEFSRLTFLLLVFPLLVCFSLLYISLRNVAFFHKAKNSQFALPASFAVFLFATSRRTPNASQTLLHYQYRQYHQNDLRNTIGGIIKAPVELPHLSVIKMYSSNTKLHAFSI